MDLRIPFVRFFSLCELSMSLRTSYHTSQKDIDSYMHKNEMKNMHTFVAKSSVSSSEPT